MGFGDEVNFFSDDKSFGWSAYNEIEDLNELEYNAFIVWKIRLESAICVLGLSTAIIEEKPNEPTNEEERAKYEQWERSDRLIILLMKRKLGWSIRLSLEEKAKDCNAKQSFDALEQLVLEMERIHAPDTFQRLATARYEGGEGGVGKHLYMMKDLARKLEVVGVVLPEDLFNQLALRSLPPKEFCHIHISYNCSKEKWDWIKLWRTCVDSEDLMRFMRENRRAAEGGGENGVKKKRGHVQCNYCGKKGHVIEDCWHCPEN
ncbi:hypothetical protein Tsubulata_047476 [Turnera subulata]|uniref:CCHC-type domain-containing protein n=1 Tax=Turnera subulata TaxID=218843 RepID=A0A9Q0GF03_9ROSI|nr:hypothetical protein Tsubulata_047476 [Turnera subulata]